MITDVPNLIYTGVFKKAMSRAPRGSGGYYETEWDGRVWKVKVGSAIVTTDDIIAPELDDFNFGKYELEFTGRRVKGGVVMRGQPHPHVHMGHPCMGNTKDGFDVLLREGDIVALYGMSVDFLRSIYIPGAYEGWWTNSKYNPDAEECPSHKGEWYAPRSYHHCEFCGRKLCPSCLSEEIGYRCARTFGYYCNVHIPRTCPSSYCHMGGRCRLHEVIHATDG